MTIAVDRNCFACIHHRDVEDDDGYLMSYCKLFDEYIDSEPLAAADCEAFETMPPAEAPCSHSVVKWEARTDLFRRDVVDTLAWAFCCHCDQLVDTHGRSYLAEANDG